MEVAEFMVPQKSQRFRKRDRFAFHGKKLMRRVATNMEKVKSDPLIIPKNFLKYAAGEGDGSTAAEDFYLQVVSGHESGVGKQVFSWRDRKTRVILKVHFISKMTCDS